MAISAPDLATVRRRTSATESEMPDAAIESIYDSTSLGNSDLARTTYYTLVELLGVLAPLVDKSSEVDNLSISASQRYDHIRDTLLPLWASITGIGVGGVSVSVTNTNTYRTDSLQAEEPTYARGTAPTLSWDD